MPADPRWQGEFVALLEVLSSGSQPRDIAALVLPGTELGVVRADFDVHIVAGPLADRVLK